MDPTAGYLTSLLPFWAEASSFCFLEGALLLFEKRTRIQNIFAPITQYIWADMNFRLNEFQNAVLHNKVPTASPKKELLKVGGRKVSSNVAVNHTIATSAQSGTPQKLQSSPTPCPFPKRQSWWWHWLHPKPFPLRVSGTWILLHLWLVHLHLTWQQFTHHHPLHTHIPPQNLIMSKLAFDLLSSKNYFAAAFDPPESVPPQLQLHKSPSKLQPLLPCNSPFCKEFANNSSEKEVLALWKIRGKPEGMVCPHDCSKVKMMHFFL